MDNKSEICKVNCFLDTLREKEYLSDSDINCLSLLYKHEDDEIRYFVAELLAKADGSQSENILLKMIKDENTLVRTNACDSLGNSKTPLVIDSLKIIVEKDKKALVRSYAVLSIGDIVKNTNLDPTTIISFLENRLKIERIRNTRISFYRTLYMLGCEHYFKDLASEINNRRYQNRCAVINGFKATLNRSNKDKIMNVIKDRLCIEKTNAVISSINQLIKDIE